VADVCDDGWAAWLDVEKALRLEFGVGVGGDTS
jgi:hypothetical protein